MVQLLEDSLFAEESLDLPVPRGDLRLDRLQGDESVSGGTGRKVNHPHAASSELAEDFIALDGLRKVTRVSQAFGHSAGPPSRPSPSRDLSPPPGAGREQTEQTSRASARPCKPTILAGDYRAEYRSGKYVTDT